MYGRAKSWDLVCATPNPVEFLAIGGGGLITCFPGLWITFLAFPKSEASAEETGSAQAQCLIYIKGVCRVVQTLETTEEAPP